MAIIRYLQIFAGRKPDHDLIYAKKLLADNGEPVAKEPWRIAFHPTKTAKKTWLAKTGAIDLRADGSVILYQNDKPRKRYSPN